MLTLDYTKSGQSVSDFEALSLSETLLNLPGNNTFSYSTENVFWAVYLKFLEGMTNETLKEKQPSRKVQFRYNGKIVPIYNGLYFKNQLPQGFLNFHSNITKAIFQQFL